MPGGIRGWLGRLARSTDELTSDERRRASEASGANTLAASGDRQRVVLQGTVVLLTVRPRKTTPWLEARLDDGTGTVTLIWMGRREIPGIEAGRTLRVEGRLSDVDGERRIYNPLYTLL